MKADRTSFPSPFAIAIICISAATLSGCVEPNYRNEVVSNGQGQIEVHRVPKDPSPPPAPTFSPARSESAVAPAPMPQGMTIDQRIATLEAQVEKLNTEITKLKLQKATGAASP